MAKSKKKRIKSATEIEFDSVEAVFNRWPKWKKELYYEQYGRD